MLNTEHDIVAYFATMGRSYSWGKAIFNPLSLIAMEQIVPDPVSVREEASKSAFGRA